MSINIELISQTAELDAQQVNKELFKIYFKEFEELAEEMNSSKDDLFRLALHSPDVLSSTLPDDDQLNALWKEVSTTVDQAIVRILEFRNQEGQT